MHKAKMDIIEKEIGNSTLLFGNLDTSISIINM